MVNIAKIFDALGDDKVLLAAVVLRAFYGFATRKRTLAYIGPVFALVPTFVIVGVMKALIDRSRPPVEHALVEVTSASMPSGHAAYAAALAATAWVLVASSPRATLSRSVALAVAVLAGIARMVLGVHWAGDIVVGWAVGGITGFCVVTALGKRLQSNE